MINASTITKQLVEWFESDVNLANFIITRSEFVNENPSVAATGWMGIYRRSIEYEPRNLGTAPNNYEADFIFDIVVQKTSMKSGADAEDSLEEATKNVIERVLLMERTHIQHFSEIFVEYTYIETDRKTMYFQGALITFTAEISFEVK